MTSQTSDAGPELDRSRRASGLKGALDRLAFAGTLAASPLGPRLTPLAARRERRIEARYPPRGRRIDVDGVPVHALTGGPEDAPELVLIHGASGNARDMACLARTFGDRFRWVAFDRPGLGYTGRTDPGHDRALSSACESLADQAALLSAAARRLGMARPLVLGHSFGGAVALAWALDRPARAVVCLGGVSQPWEGGLGPLYAILGSPLGGAFLAPAAAAFTPRAKVEATVACIFSPDPAPPDYVEAVGAPLILRRRSLTANARQMQRLKRDVAAQAPRYPDLRVPLEVVHGAADTIVPLAVHAEPLARQVPHARLTVLPGIGHMPQHAAPGAVAAALGRAHDAALALEGARRHGGHGRPRPM
jgi:pimeloyl-ACP methyl ester carboxylesterase